MGGSGRPPSIGLRATADEFTMHGDHIRHGGLETRPLTHQCGGILIRHVPEFGNRFAKKRFFINAFELIDTGPRRHSTTLNGIPRPGFPVLALTVGGSIKSGTSIVGLLDESTGIGDVHDVFRVCCPRKPGDRGTLGTIDADFHRTVVDHKQLFALRSDVRRSPCEETLTQSEQAERGDFWKCFHGGLRLIS